ncbi:MAG: DUF1800 family protein, partial [Bacteroidota bacterium]
MKQKLLCLILIALPHLIWAQLYSDYLGNGHNQQITIRSSDVNSTPEVTLDGFPEDDQIQIADASRFMAQASFGATYPTIQAVAQSGYTAWIEDQIQTPPTYLRPTLNSFIEYRREVDPEDADEDFPASFVDFRVIWFHNTMTAPDQLRQRVGLALSEIMVVSDVPDELMDSGIGLTDYYDMLLRHSLGNFRDLLMDVTLHPVMGFYLSHYNNPKSDSANNIHPDENYAREIMQLFSIGLYELNIDGTPKLDAEGKQIPTYNNDDIKQYAKVFTGLGAGSFKIFEDDDFEPGELPEFGFGFESAAHDVPMIMNEEMHEPGPKYLLRGEVIPAGQSGMKDIEDAIDNIFHHPNVGPFIGRLLIQRMVTSNPTPDYIRRVAEIFNNNGQGQRGDMAAVVKAILMDPEARACTDRVGNIHRGMLREPLIRYMHFCRTMDIRPTAQYPYFINPGLKFDAATGQTPLSSNTVFNFFLPDYQPNGIISDLDLFAPEFQIHNSTTAVGYVNEVNDWTFFETPMTFYEPPLPGEIVEEEEEEGEADPEFEIEDPYERTAYIPMDALIEMAESPTTLLSHLDLLFTHGQLSNQSRDVILDALNQIEDEKDRVQMGLYLIFISPDYNILN